MLRLPLIVVSILFLSSCVGLDSMLGQQRSADSYSIAQAFRKREHIRHYDSYYENTLDVCELIEHGRYSEARQQLAGIPVLQKDYNHLLYLLELGKILHLEGSYDSSNACFEEAELLSGSFAYARPTDAHGNVLSTRGAQTDSMLNRPLLYVPRTGTAYNPNILAAPAKKNYRPENHEKLMINYYKTLNYVMLGKKDEAIVEARKLLELNQRIEDLAYVEPYTDPYHVPDPFPHLFSGLTYEWAGQFNDAFISYENAFALFNKPAFYDAWGIDVPMQLKYDLLRLAAKIGFTDKKEYYENLFGIKTRDTANAELLLLWEKGLTPYKLREVELNLPQPRSTALSLIDTSGIAGKMISSSFEGGASAVHWVRNMNRTKRLADVKSTEEDINHHGRFVLLKSGSFPAALGYVNRGSFYKGGETVCSQANDSFHFSLHDAGTLINFVHRNTVVVNCRYVNSPGANVIATPDTRSWQTLPGSIHYLRIPLKSGMNHISVNLAHGKKIKKIEFDIEGKPGLQMRNVMTMR